MQRMKQKLNQSKETELTPSKKTENLMNQANLSEEQKNKLRKTILTGNALMRGIAETRKQEDHDGPGVAHLFHTAPGNKGS